MKRLLFFLLLLNSGLVNAQAGFSAFKKTWIAQSKTPSRDHEVRLPNPHGGIIWLRASERGALFFYYKSNDNGSGRLGYTTSYANKVGWFPMFKYWDEPINGINHELAKIGKGDGTGFIFGCRGFDVYLKYNGEEIYRTKQYVIIDQGYAGFSSASEEQLSAQGFKVNVLPAPVIYSNTATRLLDARDLGFKSGKKAGSIKGGEVKLVMKDKHHDFKEGDLGFIATGGENSFYGRKAGRHGTPGVGSMSWPGAGYKTLADLKKANPDQTFSWVHEDGKVYQRYSDGWFSKDHPIDYYNRHAVPAGHRFRVVSVEDNILTIDAPANVTTTNADVWHDNEEIFNEIYGWDNSGGLEGITLRFPEGQFMFGEYINVTKRNSFSLIGAGFGKTIFISPQGSALITLNVNFCPQFKMEGITLQGNVGHDGYGFRWFPRRLGGNPVEPPSVNTNGDYGGGLNLSHCNEFDVSVEVKNTFTGGISMSNCKRGVLKRSRYIHTTGVHTYRAWAIVTTDGTEDCVIEDTYAESPTIIGMFESYGGKNNTFRNIKGVNARISSNTSNGMVIDGFDLRFTKNAIPSWLSGPALSDPIINMNKNTGRNDESGGGVIKRGKVVFEDYLDTNGNFKPVINVQEGVNDVVINDIEITYKVPYKKGSIVGCRGVISTGMRTKVNNVRVHGENAPHAPLYGSNIGVVNGEVTNCNATTIAVRKGVKVAGNKGKVVVFE